MAVSFRVDGKCALVTGASRGPGQAMARALAEAGADVAGVATGDLAATAAMVGATGRRFVAIQEDLGASGAARRVVEHALAKLGRLDILVNNAGIIRRNAALDFTDADWDDVMKM